MYFFYLFFLFFIFFFLFIILLFPAPYTYREIVPGLGSVNYGVQLTSGITPASEINKTSFIPLVITDGEGGSPGAGTDSTIDFGGSGDSTTTVGFIPQYLDSKRPLKGYFKLFINYKDNVPVRLLFRVVDKGETNNPHPTLESYNIGWAPLTIDNSSEPEDHLYQVNVPFDTSSITTSDIHKLEVQVSYLTGTAPVSHILQLYSASVYYY